MNLTEQEQKRLDELWFEAESVFLEKMGFDPRDYLEGEELTEFERLYDKFNGYGEAA